MTTVGELLDRLHRFPPTAEVLAVEPGCEAYAERELDEVDYQDGRVYLHLGVRRDDAALR
jgi:hypothetical protein